MRGNTGQSFSSSPAPSEPAPHGTAKDLFAEKIRSYFPNAAPPNYYTDGFEHCLSFMEYEITTAKTFRSQSYAENWLFARAVKIIEKAHEVATAQIQLEKRQRMAEYSEMRERQSRNRSLSESIRNRAHAIELEYELGLKKSSGGSGGAAPGSCQEPVKKQHGNEPPERGWPGKNAPENSAGKPPSCTREASAETLGTASMKNAETWRGGVSNGFPQRMDGSFLKNRIDKAPGSNEDRKGVPNIRARDIDEMLRGNDNFHLGVFSPSESACEGDSALDGVGRTKSAYEVGGLLDELKRNDHGFPGHARTLDFSDQGDSRAVKRTGYSQEKGALNWRGNTFFRNDFAVPQKEYFNGLMERLGGERHAYIAVIRSFCSLYVLFPPEFEIVRENDVYRCTAVFCDMNFVSPYLYDKTDAKNGACKKICHYISQNWSAVFVFDHDQKQKAVHAP